MVKVGEGTLIQEGVRFQSWETLTKLKMAPQLKKFP